MLKTYRDHVAERAALGIPPLPLSAQQTGELIELLKNPPQGEEATLVELITHRVPAGVDEAAKVKASYLAAVAHGTEKCALISRERATELLGTMLGGYNISPLVDLLDDAAVAAEAAHHVNVEQIPLGGQGGESAGAGTARVDRDPFGDAAFAAQCFVQGAVSTRSRPGGAGVVADPAENIHV